MLLTQGEEAHPVPFLLTQTLVHPPPAPCDGFWTFSIVTQQGRQHSRHMHGVSLKSPFRPLVPTPWPQQPLLSHYGKSGLDPWSEGLCPQKCLVAHLLPNAPPGQCFLGSKEY